MRNIEIPIDVPQDRDSDFEPKVVPKHKKISLRLKNHIIVCKRLNYTANIFCNI